MKGREKAYILTRSSKDKHDVSCSSQERELRELADRLDLGVVDVFEDKRRSATKDSLPERERMMELLRRPDNDVKYVLVHHPSRLGRDLPETSNLIQHLRIDMGIKVRFLHLPPPDSPENILFLNMMMAFDQYHSQVSAVGARRGQRQNILLGYRSGGPCPYGYRVEQIRHGLRADGTAILKPKMVPNPETASVFQEWVRRTIQGESTNSIFTDFEARGIPSPGGSREWCRSTPTYWLEKLDMYRGVLTGGRHRAHIRRGRHVPGPRLNPKDTWTVNETGHEPLITDEEYQALQRLRESPRRRGATPTQNRRFYVLRGVLRCSCGGRVHGDGGFYRCAETKRGCCNSQIEQEALEKQIVTAMVDELFNEEFIDRAIRELAATGPAEARSKQSEVERLEGLKRKLEGRIGKLLDLYADGDVDKELVLTRIKEMQHDLKQTEASIKVMTETADVMKTLPVTTERLREIARDFLARASAASPVKFKHLIETVFEKIELGNKEGSEKRWKRKVRLFARLNSLTRDLYATPRGIEPLLPA